MESIDEVMTRYMRYVYAIVSAILGAGHDRDAEEVAADTFVAYWKTERYECSDAGTRALLGTIARHLALNRRAHIKRRYGISLPLPEDADEWIAADTSPEGSVLAHADADMLADCIRALPREDRDVFLRKYYKEETVAEIARAYGKKPKDIENRLYRIRKTMRNILIERYGKENVL